MSGQPDHTGGGGSATGAPPGAATDASAPGFDYDLPPAAPRATASGFLLDSLRKRPAGRAVLSGLTIVLFAAGVGLFAYPLATDVWTEQFRQQQLEDELVAIQADTYDEWAESVRGRAGAALTRIVIPALDVDTVVVEGTSPAALRAGAGHYPNTPLPGQVGNVAIAGHRTTYGRPFNRVDELEEGDEVWLVTPVGDYRYVVGAPPSGGDCTRADQDRAACITHPRDWGVIGQTEDPVLTLTSCHPKGSAAERIVVRAALAGREEPGTYQAQQPADAA